MKVISILFFCFIAGCTFAQFSFGVKAGLNYDNLIFDQKSLFDDIYAPKFGYHIGFYTKFPIGEQFSVDPELIYIQKNLSQKMKTQIEDVNGNFYNSYLEVTVLVSYKPIKKLTFSAGPSVAFQLKASWQGDGRKNTLDNIENLDFGLTGGIKYHLFSNVSVYSRYYRGLQSIQVLGVSDGSGNITEIKSYNSNLLFGFSIKFN